MQLEDQEEQDEVQEYLEDDDRISNNIVKNSSVAISNMTGEQFYQAIGGPSFARKGKGIENTSMVKTFV